MYSRAPASIHAPGEPAADAGPRMPRAVRRPRGGGVAQPVLVAVVAGAPDRVGGVQVERGGRDRRREGAGEELVLDLQDAEALGALPGASVLAETVPGGAWAPVRRPVAQRVLAEARTPPPPAPADVAFVDAPLACHPLQDLRRRPDVGARHPRGEQLLAAGVPAPRREEVRAAGAGPRQSIRPHVRRHRLRSGRDGMRARRVVGQR